ncbi:YnfA family protein (plasmid) [Tistrella mobilis]|uniref:YnfA family protein n=1 Tax=Tistrella mobilis TaxID=171437 RepID=UPI0035585677
MIKTVGLFVITALAEIIGCVLPALWLRSAAGAWVLLPGVAALALFVWLLTLHPAASGRVFAAYGGIYVATALVWLRVVDGVRLSLSDWAGAGLVFAGALVILAQWQR